MPDDDNLERAQMRQRVSSMMTNAWRQPGFCVPNTTVYPHQWLWDSCFHSLVWLEIDESRAVRELWSSLESQSSSGFVPHMTYWTQPLAGLEFWGRAKTSSITQPPMFGHVLAALRQRGVVAEDHGVDEGELIDRVMTGLHHLLSDRKRSPAGLVCVFHPWESGCDDSPRWPGAEMSAADWRSHGHTWWRQRKTEMVSELIFDRDTPIGSRSFEIGSVGFSSLVAWNATQAVTTLGGSHRLAESVLRDASELAQAVAARWRDEAHTWVDDPVTVSGVSDAEVVRAAAVRTSDALLALLVDPRAEGLSQLTDGNAFGGRCGPSGVHRGERSFDPEIYWRGPAWPQLSYLLTKAAGQCGRRELAGVVADALVAGATASDLAEYWHPDSGLGLGAIPQTWAGLAALSYDKRG